MGIIHIIIDKHPFTGYRIVMNIVQFLLDQVPALANSRIKRVFKNPVSLTGFFFSADTSLDSRYKVFISLPCFSLFIISYAMNLLASPMI